MTDITLDFARKRVKEQQEYLVDLWLRYMLSLKINTEIYDKIFVFPITLFYLCRIIIQEQNEKHMKNSTVILAQKKSGNYTVTNHMESAWTKVGEFSRPIDLYNAVHNLGFASVIKSEYSQSQLKTIGKMYTKKDALRAFGLPCTKVNVSNFENI